MSTMPRPRRSGYLVVFAALFALLFIQYGHAGHTHDIGTISAAAADCLLCKEGIAPAPAAPAPLLPHFDAGVQLPGDFAAPFLLRVWSAPIARAPPVSAQS